MNSDRNIPEAWVTTAEEILELNISNRYAPSVRQDIARQVLTAVVPLVKAATVNRCIEAIESDPMRNNGASSYGMGLASHALRSLLPATPAEQPTTGPGLLRMYVEPDCMCFAKLGEPHQASMDCPLVEQPTTDGPPVLSCPYCGRPVPEGFRACPQFCRPVEQPTVTDGAGKTFHDRVHAEMTGVPAGQPDATAKCGHDEHRDCPDHPGVREGIGARGDWVPCPAGSTV